MDRDLFERIVGTVVRNGVSPVVTYLVAKGWLAESDSIQLVAVAVTSLAAVIWGIIAKYKEAALRKLALDLPAGSTPEQLKEVAK